MALPLYLALTAAELSKFAHIPFPCAYMSCHFSPNGLGLSGIPGSLPAGAILILDDRTECNGHDPDLVVRQLQDTVIKLNPSGILLDFQRPPEPQSLEMARIITQALSFPVAAAQAFAEGLHCPVFLSPAPLHMPLSEHLAPWKHREIWLEAALSQEEIIVTKEGAEILPRFPAVSLAGGIYDEELCCHYHIKTSSDRITFTLYDTFESLEKKLELAQTFGVRRAVGLWQELGTFLPGK